MNRDLIRKRLNAMEVEYREYVSQLRNGPGGTTSGATAIKRFEEVATDLEFAATIVAWAPAQILKCVRLGIQPEDAT